MIQIRLCARQDGRDDHRTQGYSSYFYNFYEFTIIDGRKTAEMSKRIQRTCFEGRL